jgi:hypothetical protein
MVARLYAQDFPAPAGGEATAGAAATSGGEAFSPVVAPVSAPAALPTVRVKTPPQVGRLPKYGSLSTVPNVLASRPPPRRREPEPEVVPPVSEPVAATADAATVPDAASALSAAEMEARLIAGIEIPEAELLALADARAQAIRAWLIETGKVPAERIFLVPATASGLRTTLNLK